jgi:NTP pyrophosphatase (non-canonical NTP hydrolase)
MKEVINKVINFRNERGWEKFHNSKDLAISLALEANELPENFQWKSSKEAVENKYENIKKEVADVMIYLILISHQLGIDLEEAALKKLEKNARKYPVEKAYGSNKKYNEL